MPSSVRRSHGVAEMCARPGCCTEQVVRFPGLWPFCPFVRLPSPRGFPHEPHRHQSWVLSGVDITLQAWVLRKLTERDASTRGAVGQACEPDQGTGSRVQLLQASLQTHRFRIRQGRFLGVSRGPGLAIPAPEAAWDPVAAARAGQREKLGVGQDPRVGDPVCWGGDGPCSAPALSAGWRPA